MNRKTIADREQWQTPSGSVVSQAFPAVVALEPATRVVEPKRPQCRMDLTQPGRHNPDTLFPPPPSERWCGEFIHPNGEREKIGCLHFDQRDAQGEADYWSRVLRTSVSVIQLEVHTDAR